MRRTAPVLIAAAACLSVVLIAFRLDVHEMYDSWAARHEYFQLDEIPFALTAVAALVAGVLLYRWGHVEYQYSRARRIDPTLAENARDLKLINEINHALNSGARFDSTLGIVAQGIGEIFDCPGVGVYLLSEDGRHLRAENRSIAETARRERASRDGADDTLIPIEEDGYLRRVIASGESHSTDDPQEIVAIMGELTETPARRKAIPTVVALLRIKSLMMIPIRANVRAAGILAVARSEPFTARDEQRLLVIAEELSGALSRKRLEEQLSASREAARMRADDAEMANRLNGAINEGESLDQILVRFSQEARRTFYVKEAIVLLLGADRRSLELQANTISASTVREAKAIFRLEIPPLRNPLPEDSHYWTVLTGRRSVMIDDRAGMEKAIGEFLDSPSLKSVIRPATEMLGLRHLLTIPLVAGDEVIGVSDLYRDRPFTEQDVERFEGILSSLTVALGRKKLEDELERSEERFRRLSLIDDLTGLYNRRGLDAVAEHQVRLAEREKMSLALIYCDVDGLKAINDKLGHSVGDEALVDVAELLKETFRESDIICRLGGDEFAVLTVNVSKAAADSASERLMQAVAAANQKSARPYVLSVSVGVAHWSPDSRRSLADAIKEADRRMYEHKSRHDEWTSERRSA